MLQGRPRDSFGANAYFLHEFCARQRLVQAIRWLGWRGTLSVKQCCIFPQPRNITAMTPLKCIDFQLLVLHFGFGSWPDIMPVEKVSQNIYIYIYYICNMYDLQC